MSDFQKYKAKRIKNDPEYWDGYQERFESFKVGVLLKQARKEAGFTQADTVRFIQQFETGQGNYTEERHQWLDELSIDEVSNQIEENRD